MSKVMGTESKEDQAKRQVAADLGEALAFLRTATRTDYFTGYSLAETLKQRISQIGPDKDATAMATDPYTGSDQYTQMARLSQFETKVALAIEAARKLP